MLVKMPNLPVGGIFLQNHRRVQISGFFLLQISICFGQILVLGSVSVSKNIADLL